MNLLHPLTLVALNMSVSSDLVLQISSSGILWKGHMNISVEDSSLAGHRLERYILIIIALIIKFV